MIRKTPRVTEEATYTEPGCREGGHVLHPSSPLHLSEWGVSLHLLYRDLLWVSSILGSGSPSGGLWADGAKFHEREHFRAGATAWSLGTRGLPSQPSSPGLMNLSHPGQQPHSQTSLHSRHLPFSVPSFPDFCALRATIRPSWLAVLVYVCSPV